MKHLKLLVLAVFVLASINTKAQKKKVAVVTFYADKVIDLSSISGAANLIAQNSELADSPNFNLTAPLQKLHKAFFEEYKDNFDFEIIDESVVFENEMYQNFVPTYEEQNTFIFNAETTTSIEGYNVIPAFRRNVKDLKQVAEDLGVDGIMFVQLSFGFNKTGVGKFGYVSVQARFQMDLFSKDNNSIFRFREIAGSKKKAPMVGGIPVMKPEKIQPMCESATDKLMEDLNKKVARLAKKANKKLK